MSNKIRWDYTPQSENLFRIKTHPLNKIKKGGEFIFQLIYVQFFLFIFLSQLKLSTGQSLATNQLTITHYVSTNKIIHLYFTHMIYLMSHVTSLNNTCEWSYKLPYSRL